MVWMAWNLECHKKSFILEAVWLFSKREGIVALVLAGWTTKAG